AIVRLSDSKRKTLGEKGIDCISVGYAEHSKAYRFYVIEPNDSISINSIIESRDAIFYENRFSSIPRQKDIIPNSDESQRDDHSDDVPKSRDTIFDENHFSSIPRPKDIILNSDESQRDDHSDDVPSEIPEPRKEKRRKILKPEAMQSRDAAFLKEAVDDEIGCKWIFKRKMKVDGTIDKFKAVMSISKFDESGKGVIICLYVDDVLIFGTNQNQADKTKKFLSSKFSMKDIGEADVILGYLSVLEGYFDASWINHVRDLSSTRGWVFLLGGGAILRASNKLSCPI
ncbi:zinc finger, CCHC-type containing protein, partial [Tanacetum coccineum]